MFFRILKAKRFWLSVLFLSFAFIVLFNLIRIIVEFKFGFATYFKFYFQSHRFPSFAVANLMGGFFYGFAMAYFRYWRHLKNTKGN